MRELLRDHAPELRVEKKQGHPRYTGSDLLHLMGALEHRVGVEFWRGAALRDPARVLEGTDTNLRHAKRRTRAEAPAPTFVPLVRKVIQLDRTLPPRVR